MKRFIDKWLSFYRLVRKGNKDRFTISYRCGSCAPHVVAFCITDWATWLKALLGKYQCQTALSVTSLLIETPRTGCRKRGSRRRHSGVYFVPSCSDQTLRSTPYRRSASLAQLHAIDARTGKLTWCKSATFTVNHGSSCYGECKQVR